VTLRPPPGLQVSTGRLRVDAARAIAKLREYQLVDRLQWVLEAIRGAIALGATSIELAGDANDVRLRWTGPPLPADDLSRLFDELVSPEPGADRHGVRLLAAAINSALGTRPAYVDVIAIDEATSACVRYTPEVLDAPESELSASSLRRLEVRTVARDPAAARGVLVHLRRRVTIDVVQNFFRGEPPELSIARAHCHTIGVPLTIGGRTFDGHALGDDLLRLPLGNDLAGFVAIVDPASQRAHLTNGLVEIAERGVVLDTFEDAFGITPVGAAVGEVRPPPLRLVVDAPKLPTNASRSEVRRDEHPIRTALARARELVPELITQLVRAVAKAPEDPRLRAAAVALLATHIGGERWKENARQLKGPLAQLAELPLLYNALGELRALRASWLWASTHHRGDAPVKRELAPWFEDVLWVPPGDAAERLVRPDTTDLMRNHLRWARRQLRMRRRFLAHAPREPRVIDEREPLVRARLGAGIDASCVPASAFDRLTGELCLYAKPGGELTVLYDGRELERLHYVSPLGFAAVIESTTIRPADAYRAAVRNADFAHVERAMRAQVVRAIEALAARCLGDPVPDGIEVAPTVDPAQARQLADQGIDLARELGAELRAPLSRIAVWPTLDHRHASLDELRAHPAIGITTAPRGSGSALSLGMPVVHVQGHDGRRRLEELVSSSTVTYLPEHVAYVTSTSSHAVFVPDGVHYLERHDDDLHGIIAPARGGSRLLVFHRGVRLTDYPLAWSLLPCTIIVEASHVIPSSDWLTLADDRGLRERDLGPWEAELLRAAARALVGERPPLLHGPDALTLHSELARALFEAFTRTDPGTLLGEELLAKLRTQPLVARNGSRRQHSLDELAIAFPDDIPYVPFPQESVEGLSPLVATPELASGIAALLGRTARDGTTELEARRATFARDLRLAAHRARPVEALSLPAGTAPVQVTTSAGRGLVGLGLLDRMELQLFVEGRPFRTEVLEDGPLIAALEVRVEDVDATFERIPIERVSALVAELFEHVPAVLVAEVNAGADLANSRGAHQLVARWATRRGDLPDEARARLAAKVAFRTVQGTDEPLAPGPETRVAAWHGEWLPPATGELRHALDEQVLYVAQGDELRRAFVRAIGNAKLADVTSEVSQLQIRRRIAHGRLPMPRAGTPSHLTRPLSSFGEAARGLGHGEIGLVDGPSFVRVHTAGELRELVPIEVVPGVHVAIDAAFLSNQVTAVVQPIARELAHDILRRFPTDPSLELRRMLRRAVLARALTEDAALAASLFPTNDGAWLSAHEVQAQQRAFGNVWSIPVRERALRPNAPERRVLVLPSEEVALATTHSWGVIDGVGELGLDATERANRARPKTASLHLPSHGTLATIELEGDGNSAPRGFVGVLAPSGANRRGVWAHREQHPFDAVRDPCPWPTIAFIDDARLIPDRTWASPVADATWRELETAVRRASEAAFERITAPRSALVSLHITPALLDSLAFERPAGLELRGIVWLDRPSLPSRVAIFAGSERSIDLVSGGLHGRVFAYAPGGSIDGTIYTRLLEDLHRRLVRQLAEAGPLDDDLVRAHVAEALAMRRLSPAQVPTFSFPCFSPVALSSDELEALLRASTPVRLVNDGSETFRVLVRRLSAWRDHVITAPTPQPASRPQRAAAPLAPAPAPHRLAPLVDAVHRRLRSLGIPSPAFKLLDDRTRPLARYRDDALELAADNAHVLAVAAAHAANAAAADDALDLLVAHVIAVLDEQRGAITAATHAAAIAQLVQRR